MNELLRLATDTGFIEAFWALYRQHQTAGQPLSQRAVYEELNDRYEAAYGEERFPSFDAFRMVRDRARKKLRTKANK